MGGGAPRDNSAEVAREQRRIREEELKFEEKESRRNQDYRNQMLGLETTANDRRYQLDLKADARADSAQAFNQDFSNRQIAYQTQRDAQLYGLQQTQLQQAEADRTFYRERSTREEQRILQKEEAAAAKEAARSASAQAGYEPFKQSIESQLRGG